MRYSTYGAPIKRGIIYSADRNETSTGSPVQSTSVSFHVLLRSSCHRRVLAPGGASGGACGAGGAGAGASGANACASSIHQSCGQNNRGTTKLPCPPPQSTNLRHRLKLAAFLSTFRQEIILRS